MRVPNMWKLIVVYFCGLSFTITNLQAINVTNNLDNLNDKPTINRRTNGSQIPILDNLNVVNHHHHSPSNNLTDETFTLYKNRKVVKRATLPIFGRKIDFQVELGIFGYSKIILFAILRIFFGVSLNISKLKQTVIRPIGPTIALLCHWIFLPLISYGFGWIFFADRTTKRLDFFESGYAIGLHTFVFEPGYIVVEHKRYVVLIISNCLTLLLGGNIEVSLVANIFIVLHSQCMGAESLFYMYERIFNSDNIDNRFGPAASSGFNFVWPLYVSIVLSVIGILIQCIWPKSKQCAMTTLKRLSIFYVVCVLIVSYSYLFIMFGYSILMQFDYNNSSHLMANMKIISIDFLGYSLAIFGYIIGYFFAKMMKQKTDDSIAIAVESIAQNLFLDITLLPLALCLCRCRRQPSEHQNDTENLTNNACHGTELQNGSNIPEIQTLR